MEFFVEKLNEFLLFSLTFGIRVDLHIRASLASLSFSSRRALFTVILLDFVEVNVNTYIILRE